MKTFRLCLLVLLAVLLPLRGAVAATMLCPPAKVASQRVSAEQVAHHPMAADHGGEHQHAGHMEADQSANTAHHGDSAETCNLCCYFCAMTPLLSVLPSLAAPTGLSSVSFPELAAPAPSFLSDGQERPPRTI